MRIRAVTVGSHIRYASGRVSLDSRISSFIEAAFDRFSTTALAPQTTRLAAQPFPSIVPPERDAVVDFARALEAAGADAGFGYLSIGPAGPDSLDYVPYLIEAILNTDSVFGTVITGDRQGASPCWPSPLPSGPLSS